MRERLREVAEVATAVRIDLLRVQPEGAGEREQFLAQLMGSIELADLDQRRHQPERADRECTLLALQAVVGLLGPVAQDQAIDRELVGDREDRRPDARVVGGQEAHERSRSSEASSALVS